MGYESKAVIANLGVTFWITAALISVHALIFAKFLIKKLCKIKHTCTEKDFSSILSCILIRFMMLSFLETTLCCVLNYTALDFSQPGKHRISSILSIVMGALCLLFFCFIVLIPKLHEAVRPRLDRAYFDTALHGLVTANVSKATLYLGLYLTRRVVFSLLAVLSNGF